MKNVFLFMLFLSSIFYSCEGIEFGKPISTNKDTTLFTVEGRYLNGTSNTPYRNIELTLKMDNYGYPRVLEEIAGPIRTDNNGYFKFTYRFIDRSLPIFLKVYPTDLYPNIDSIPMNQNLYKDVYMSDFSRLILTVELKNTSDLYVSVGNKDTLHYTNLNSTVIDSLYNLPINRTLIAWGSSMSELRDALKGKNSNQQYLNTLGDPFYNNFKITY